MYFNFFFDVASLTKKIFKNRIHLKNILKHKKKVSKKFKRIMFQGD